jgi:hypothetical protein
MTLRVLPLSELGLVLSGGVPLGNAAAGVVLGMEDVLELIVVNGSIEFLNERLNLQVQPSAFKGEVPP